MEATIDHINRYVSDVERHITFYRELLGYRVLGRGRKRDGSRFVILGGGGHEMFLSEKKGLRPPDEEGAFFRHLGYSVGNADDFLARAKSAGFAGEDQEVTVKPFSRQVYLRDPDGFEIDFIQWTDRRGFLDQLSGEGEQS